MARNYSSVVEPKTLTANVGSSDVQITLNNVTGLPSAPYVLVLNPDTVKEEAVLVTVDQTGVTSPTLKVERAIEARSGLGTAQTHSVGNTVKHMIIGSDMQIVHDHFSNDNTTTGTAHGATGGVVGRTNSQTLTNKTVNLTDNTLTGTKAQFNAALSDADFATIGGTETLTAKTLTTPTITSPVITGGTINGGAALTVDSTELNKLDGVTATTAEINALDTLTASRAIVSNASGILTAAVTTDTEISRLSGLSSNVQTQLNAKLSLSGGTVTGTTNFTGALQVDGSTLRKTAGGQSSASASTYDRITHGIGATPSSIVLTQRSNATTGSPRIFYATNVGATYFDVYALDTAGNQQSGAYYWLALGP
jgi:hypothetical protein